MAIRIPRLREDSQEEIKGKRTMLKPTRWYGGPPDDRLKRLREDLDKEETVYITPEGGIVEESGKSHWYCFITSLDREQDVSLIKELLFWGTLYHNDDGDIEILIPGYAGKRYDYYRRVFQVSDVPCLILTDTDKYPVDFILISKNLINTEYLGDSFMNLREMLEFLHNTLMNEGNLREIKKELFKKKFETIIGKTWNEIKSLISLNIGG